MENLNLNSSKQESFTGLKTVEDLLELYNLTDWPRRDSNSAENLLEIDEFRQSWGNEEDIYEMLRSATIDPGSSLEELSERLDQLDQRIQNATELMNLERRDPGHSQVAVYQTEIQGQTENEKIDEKCDMKNTSAEALARELEKSSVDRCFFPGFNKTRLTKLPGILEPAQILHIVTSAQTFKHGFLKIWIKIFQSDATVAILQDTFWWTFLDKFMVGDNLKERSQFFDRISDSFVALMASIHSEVKDKAVSVYSNCLAQAVYVTYFSAFPESQHKFDDNFKQYLLNTTYEWVAGFLPTNGLWKSWNMGILTSGRLDKTSQSRDISLLSSIVHNTYQPELSMDEFLQVIGNLSEDGDVTKQDPVDRPKPNCLKPNSDPSKAPYLSKFPSDNIARREIVTHSIHSQSPLVAHYFKMHSDKRQQFRSAKLHRMQDIHEPENEIKLKEGKDETNQKQQAKERLSTVAEKQIAKIEKHEAETNEKIANLQRSLMSVSNLDSDSDEYEEN